MENVKGNIRRLIPLALSAMALLLCLIVFVTPAVPTQAAKLTDKSAKKILKKLVKGVPCHYSFVDFDNDGIDEMVVLGFSEEFNEYDIKERSVTVYKVENKKAKVIFRDYVTGDRTHPYIEFYLYKDSKGNTYIQVWKKVLGDNYCQEDATAIMYVYNDGTFDMVGKVEIDETGSKYFIGSDASTEDEYNDFFDDAFSNETGDYHWCSGKIDKNFKEKVLMAELDRRCEQGLIDKDKIEWFLGENDDGLIYLRAVRSDNSWYDIDLYDEHYITFLSAGCEYKGMTYFQALYSEHNCEEYLGTWVCDDYTLTISEYLDRYKINIVQNTGKGKGYEWEYIVVFADIDEYPAEFMSDFWGTKVKFKTNSKTGKTTSKLLYEDGFADFSIEDGVLTWYDRTLVDNYGRYKKSYGKLKFVKQ